MAPQRGAPGRRAASAAQRERWLLADEFDRVGPDAPTLCQGWSTRQLAAHLVVRERRPDAAPGILLPALSPYTARVQQGIADIDWDQLIDLVRNGPPLWAPTRVAAVDRAVNTTEFFVHHEDVRRAQPDWSVRDLDVELDNDLYGALRRSARLLARNAPAGVVLEPDDGRDPVEAKSSHPQVAIRGPLGELVLWLHGRQRHSEVSYIGAADAIELLRQASFGM